MRSSVVLFLCVTAAAAASKKVDDFEKMLVKDGGVDLATLHRVEEELKEQRKEQREAGQDNEKVAADVKKERDLHRADEKRVDVSENAVNQAAGLGDDLFEGDIMLAPDQLKQLAAELEASNGTRYSRQAVRGKKWPLVGGVVTIPYKIQSTYPAEYIPTIKLGMAYMEANTCLKFVPYNAAVHANGIYIKDGAGCSSYVGLVNVAQPQDVILASGGCTWLRTVVHELSHAVGLHHMQSRPDRALYVNVDYNRLSAANSGIFSVQTDVDTFDYPYEFGSNMHYMATDFSKDYLPVLAVVNRTRHEPYASHMKGRRPSFLDFQLLNERLGCTVPKCSTTPPTCQYGGYVSVKDCTKCVCPAGRTGVNCADRPAGTVVVDATTAKKTLAVTMGVRGAAMADYPTSKFYVIQAPSGKRVKMQVAQIYAETGHSICMDVGIDIKYQADQTLAGVSVCNANHNPVKLPVTSEYNKIVLEVFTRGRYINANITYQYI